jgi:hypothetical protein
MTWNQFLQLIAPIPRTFWGYVAGAGFLLLSAWLISRASLERQLKAQSKDRELRRTQEEMAARREVFLPAAEALTVGMNCIMRFAELELPESELTAPFVERAPAIDKLYLMASSDAVTAVNRLSTELNAAYSRLHIKRLPLALQKAQLGDLASSMESISKERDRWLEIMNQDNLSWRPDTRKREAIERNLDPELARERSTEAAERYRQLLDKLFAKECELSEECARESAALRQLFVAVITGVRAELGLGSSQREIEQALTEGTRRTRTSNAEMLQKVRHIVATQHAEQAEPVQGIVVEEPMIAPLRRAASARPGQPATARR